VTTREQVRDLVDSRRFQLTIIGVIIVNAITLGLETSPKLAAEGHHFLHYADRTALGIFVVELILRLYAHGWRFFKDPWSIFDLLVVGIALVPATGPFSVLRALRVLRVLRLMSAVPAMRRVVGALLGAVPGLASIAALLFLIIYVAGVMATQMFRHAAPQYFDDLGSSLFTLFQTMTGEAWPDVARTVMKEEPVAWIFFVVYIVVSTFAVLNLFIAVIVNGMEHGVTDEMVQAEEKHAADQAASDRLLLDEIRALRAEVAALRADRAVEPG
jgi:voltage-gated sodium channel